MPQCRPSRDRKSLKKALRINTRCGITSVTRVARRCDCSTKVMGS
jgi:hypothetical protein